MTGIELKWETGSECPRDQIEFIRDWEGWTPEMAIGLEWSEDIISGGTTIQMADVSFLSTSKKIRFRCMYPGVDLALKEINIFGITDDSAGAQPESDATFEGGESVRRRSTLLVPP